MAVSGAIAARLAVVWSLIACGTERRDPFSLDTGLTELALSTVEPAVFVPGTEILVTGRSFVANEYGEARLRLLGSVDGKSVDLSLGAEFMDYEHLKAHWGGTAAMGRFSGRVYLEYQSRIDGLLHLSDEKAMNLEFWSELQPNVESVTEGFIFVNHPIRIAGERFLLGGEEGLSVAVIRGCMQHDRGECLAIMTAEVPAKPEQPFDRNHLTFAFEPNIAGITPGRFQGTITIENRQRDGVVLSGPDISVSYDLLPPAVFSIDPPMVSLGQYVNVHGAGFAGAAHGSPEFGDSVTLLALTGKFTKEGATQGLDVDLTLIPEWVSGPLVRYVVDEEDELGRRADLRRVAGRFDGTMQPIIEFGGERVEGVVTRVSLGLSRLKQVVWLNFQPSYVESLRDFGLRALDRKLRERILAVARRDYAGTNVDFRLEVPTDFQSFAQVDIGGADPNEQGYFGYDNTPGKDVGNERLYDKIGGVNAQTQEDGYAGYGGIFIESFFGFSEHPGDLAPRLDVASGTFDDLFDPFRPDLGGQPVLAGDLDALSFNLPSGSGCPAVRDDRAKQTACALFTLGSMIGTTMTHEIGHSLGLANPHGSAFHNSGDQPNRLMDSGGAGTLEERAELFGEGPAVFCDEDYEYLRDILPGDDPEPDVRRPGCY